MPPRFKNDQKQTWLVCTKYVLFTGSRCDVFHPSDFLQMRLWYIMTTWGHYSRQVWKHGLQYVTCLCIFYVFLWILPVLIVFMFVHNDTRGIAPHSCAWTLEDRSGERPKETEGSMAAMVCIVWTQMVRAGSETQSRRGVFTGDSWPPEARWPQEEVQTHCLLIV